MEELLEFNGVKVLLTSGYYLHQVQNFLEEADVVISVDSKANPVIRVIKTKYTKEMTPLEFK